MSWPIDRKKEERKTKLKSKLQPAGASFWLLDPESQRGARHPHKTVAMNFRAED